MNAGGATRMTAADYRTHLGRLMAERFDAVEAGLDRNATYMNDLDIELVVCLLGARLSLRRRLD